MTGTEINGSYQSSQVQLNVSYPAGYESQENDDDLEGRQCCTRRTCRIIRGADYTVVTTITVAASVFCFYHGLFTFGILFGIAGMTHAYALCGNNIKLSDRSWEVVRGSAVGLISLCTVHDLCNNAYNSWSYGYWIPYALALVTAITIIFPERVHSFCCSERSPCCN